MTTRVLRLGLALIVAVLGSPGLALAASAASTTDLACPDGSDRLADFSVQGDGFVATTGAAAVSVIGSGSGGTFRVVDTTQAVTAVLVAGPDGPVATKIDNYSGGTSSGSFDPASFVSDDGTPATVTSVSFCGGAAAISSAQCQDQPAFSSTWDGAGTFSVTLAGTLALCEAVEFHVGSYALDAPAGWDGQPSFSPGATPQTEFDHQLIVFNVGDEPGTRSATVAAPACGPYQADLYTGARRMRIDAAGHGSDFLGGGLLAGTACAEPPTAPTTGPEADPRQEPEGGPTTGPEGGPTGPTTGPTSGPGGPEVGPESEPEAVSAAAAVDCARSALVLTLSNRGAGSGSGSSSEVDFVVDGALHVVPAGENRSVVLPVAHDAAYRVLVSFPGDSQTFSGVLSCSPADSGSSSDRRPLERGSGEPGSGQPSGASVPGEPAGAPIPPRRRAPCSGSAPPAPDGSEGEVGPTGGRGGHRHRGRSQGSADLPGRCGRFRWTPGRHRRAGPCHGLDGGLGPARRRCGAVPGRAVLCRAATSAASGNDRDDPPRGRCPCCDGPRQPWCLLDSLPGHPLRPPWARATERAPIGPPGVRTVPGGRCPDP